MAIQMVKNNVDPTKEWYHNPSLMDENGNTVQKILASKK